MSVTFSRYFKPELFNSLTKPLLNNLQVPSIYQTTLDGFEFTVVIGLEPIVSNLTNHFTLNYRYGFSIKPTPNNPEAIRGGVVVEYNDEIETNDQRVDPIKIEHVANAVINAFYFQLSKLKLTELEDIEGLPAMETKYTLDLPKPKSQTSKLEIVK